MSTIFSMKGGNAPYHGAHSPTPLEIRGHWMVQGPQPIDDNGGVPEAVHRLFQLYPEVQRIAMATERGGSVWQRLEPAAEVGVDVPLKESGNGG